MYERIRFYALVNNETVTLISYVVKNTNFKPHLHHPNLKQY